MWNSGSASEPETGSAGQSSAPEQPTPTHTIKSAQNAKSGVPGAPSLHRAELPTKQSMRRRATPGTHGGDVSNRVSADAVGRRGPFPEGRLSTHFEKCCLSGKCTERGRAAGVSHTPTLMRPRRPGPKLNKSAKGCLTPFSELTVISKRPRRPGCEGQECREGRTWHGC